MEQLLDEIREHIGDPDIEAKLWDNKPHFNQICSSLDTIGDTQYAIDAYFNSECGETLGALYIAVYGLFFRHLYCNKMLSFILCLVANRNPPFL